MDNSNNRYQRQQRLPQIGVEGQNRLARAKVGLVGLGALGSINADLLARAGVGHLVLIDRDIVEWSNLQRQSLYQEADAEAGFLKAEAAATYLAKVNSSIDYTVRAIDLNPSNIQNTLKDCDLVIDGSDNFAVRYLLNDWAVKNRVPFIYAGAVATYGMSGAVLPNGPCLRCTWPEPPSAENSPTCRSAGVIGPIIHSVAAHAVGEAIKVLVGKEDDVLPGFLMQDLWQNDFRTLKASNDPDCPCCSKKEFLWLDSKIADEPVIMCGNESVQFPAKSPFNLQVISDKLKTTVEISTCNENLLRFRSNDLEILLFADGRALVRGTDDPARAKSILSKTIGT